MTRPDIDIVVPIQKESAQLDRTVDLLHRHSGGFRLHVLKEPDLNVSEARQKALDEVVKGDLVCFIDDDSEMVMDGWLDRMHQVMVQQPDAGAVFAGEWWGTDSPPAIDPSGRTSPAGDWSLADAKEYPGQGEPFMEVAYGPAACMLLDRRRLPRGLRWDPHIGLRSGWLGGDFEEVDYCFRLRLIHGLRLYRATNTLFHHTGGRAGMREFALTDRFRTVNIMHMLLGYKYHKAPGDEDWFKGLKYVRASGADDCMLAPGESLRTCYRDVIAGNGLSYVRKFHRWGLVD